MSVQSKSTLNVEGTSSVLGLSGLKETTLGKLRALIFGILLFGFATSWFSGVTLSAPAHGAAEEMLVLIGVAQVVMSIIWIGLITALGFQGTLTAETPIYARWGTATKTEKLTVIVTVLGLVIGVVYWAAVLLQ